MANSIFGMIGCCFSLWWRQPLSHSIYILIIGFLLMFTGYMSNGSPPNVFAVQLQNLINRESSYIQSLDQLRDAFWMPLARRYLSSNGRQESTLNHRRRFSLMGFMHVPQDPNREDVMRTLNGLFGYLPAIRTTHVCLLEELKVL
jgi:hypothetical protein